MEDNSHSVKIEQPLGTLSFTTHFRPTSQKNSTEVVLELELFTPEGEKLGPKNIDDENKKVCRQLLEKALKELS